MPLTIRQGKASSKSENYIDINDLDIHNYENLKPSCRPRCCVKDDPEFMDVEFGFDYLNVSLTSIGESPIIKSKCKSSKR